MNQTPLLKAWLLESRGKFANAAVAGLVWGLFLAAVTLAWPAVTRYLAMQPVAVAAAFVLLSAAWAHVGRQRFTVYYQTGWLATLPLKRRTVRATVVIRTFAVPVLGLLPIAMGMALSGCVLPAARGSSLLLATYAIGTGVGSLAGWFLPRRSLELGTPASQRAVASPSIARPRF